MADRQYIKLCTIQISENRAFVFSKCSTGGYTLAQRITAKHEDGTATNFFMKNALHIGNLTVLKALIKGLELVAEKIEKEQGRELAELEENIKIEEN